MWRSLLSLSLIGACITLSSDAQAQIVPDATLNTQVTLSTITGGTRSGNNLFHSFRDFSIPTGGSAIFDNAIEVENIFTRVTGRTISNIDGVIRANGTANLFLLNPNGVVFGSQAQLNIGGSFIGATAKAIQFADGKKLSADPSEPPLLTISAPVGLQFGQQPGAILVQGQGHLMQISSTFAPVIGAGQETTGLRVNPNRTLALIGGEINLDGGILSAPSGHIELGSVADGVVNFTPNQFSYDSIAVFREIRLTNRSAIDATGFGNATVQLVGRKIAINNGSIALIVNRSQQPGGNLRIIASEAVELSGRSSTNPEFGSFLVSDAFAGSSANLSITTPRLSMFDRGIVLARTFASASGGNISIHASEVQIDGKLDNSLSLHSGFLPSAMGSGNMGEFVLTARQLNLVNGGYINASTFGSGSGAEVRVQANTVRVDGVNSLGQSSIIAAAAFSSGNAGNLTINARQIVLTDSGTVSTATFASGKAGNATLNATQSVTITGRIIPSPFSTTDGVGSSANILPLAIRQLIGLPDRPNGDSGDVIVTTNQLTIRNGGEIKVDNQGMGNAGTIRINANSIDLKHRGAITGETTAGVGGNISLEARSLLLRDRSSITTTAGGTGNGGNITIQVPVIIGLENSDIVANAIQGRGGNINITTEALLGLQYRDRLTADNDITASSEFGLSGTVQVNNFGVDPNNGLTELATNLVDANQQVAEGCSTHQGSSFVFTGRGGIPQNPTEQVSFDRPWVDLRDLVIKGRSTVSFTQSEPLLEATSWYRNAQTGKIELIAAQTVQSSSRSACPEIAPESNFRAS